MCLVEQLHARCSCDPIECQGTYKPVCGKDGHTYINDCTRRKAECLSKALILVKHPGPCGEWSRRAGRVEQWLRRLSCSSSCVSVCNRLNCEL